MALRETTIKVCYTHFLRLSIRVVTSMQVTTLDSKLITS